MKNRKLFAIITLVAFMLTMMPMMAFATSASGSSISVEDGSAKVGDKLEFTLDVDSALNVNAETAKLKAAKDAADAAVAAVLAEIEDYNAKQTEEEQQGAKITITGEGYERVAAAGTITGTGGKAIVDRFNTAIGKAKTADTAYTTGFKYDQFVIVFAERNGSLSDVDTLSATGGDDKGKKGVLVFENIDKAQEIPVYVTSNTAGTVTMKAYVISGYNEGFDASDIATLYNGGTDFLKTGFIGNGCTGKFNPTNSDITADATVTYVNTSEEPDQKVNILTQLCDDETAQPLDLTGADNLARSNNGVDYYDFSLKFEKGGSKLVGEDVTVYIDKIGATTNKEELTTSATGKADFKVSATKPGTYTVTVECGSFTQEFKVEFVGTNMTKAEFASVVTGTIATEEIETKAMKFDVYDGNGNLVTATDDVDFDTVFEVEVTSAPEDSALEGEEYADEVYNDNGQYVLNFEPDMPGTYTIKVYNKTTGVSDIATIKADEFGTIDHATISYPSATYALGAQTPVPTVYVYDQNGVKKQGSNKSFSYTGLGVSKFVEANGQITFKSDAEYAGNEVVVSVVTNNRYAASTTLTIGAAPASIEFETASGKAGEEVTVTGQVVDMNGNKAAISAKDDYDVQVQSAIIIERPAGAIVSVDYDDLDTNANVQRDFLQKGLAPVTIASNTEGTVKVNLVVKLTAKANMIVDGVEYKVTGLADGEAANPYVMYLSGVATVGVGVNAGDVDTANDVVTFIIGTNTFIANDKVATSDVAPYIVDGRTFIPVRAFVEATGAAVEYDAATQVVTITGDGIDAQMTIGSNILTVNGETVVMDTAAAIKDGRTVLPVRYAGQAIGYDFECAYGANGAVTAVTMFK